VEIANGRAWRLGGNRRGRNGFLGRRRDFEGPASAWFFRPPAAFATLNFFGELEKLNGKNAGGGFLGLANQKIDGAQGKKRFEG